MSNKPNLLLARTYPDYLPEILEEIGTQNGMHGLQIEYASGSADGDGFVASLCRATITSSNNKRLSLICKYQSSSHEHRVKYCSDKLFEREIFVYNHIVPEIKRIQTEFKIDFNDGFFAYPKCYYACHDPSADRSILILEDLCETGFKVHNSSTLVGLEYVEPLFKLLGRFHAVSFAIRHYNPEMLKTFRKMTDLLCDSMAASSMVETEKRHREFLPEILEDEEDHVKEKVMQYKDNLWSEMRKLVDGDASEPYSVVTHGDCWINNLMFNYCDKNLVKSVALLDFQHCRYASPVTDLTYFLFTCTDRDFRANHFSRVINAYHQSLSELLIKFNLEPNDVFSKTVMYDHLKEFGKFAMGIAVYGIAILCNYRWDGATDDEENSKCFIVYKDRLADILRDFVRLEVL